MVTDVAEMLMRTALVPGGKSEQGVVDIGLRLHVAELFMPELRKVAAGKDDIEVGCDRDKENEANGGAPRTVFKKRAGEAGGASDAAGGKSPGGKHHKKGKVGAGAGAGGGAKVRVNAPKPVPSAAVETLLQPFAALLQFDTHAPLHRHVLNPKPLTLNPKP